MPVVKTVFFDLFNTLLSVGKVPEEVGRDPGIPHTLIEQATLERQARFDYALLNIEDEVLATLARLKDRSMRMCLISNASTAEVAAWQHSPLASMFDKAVFSCECGMQKPDVGIFQHALAQVNADPGDSLFIGDGGSHEFIGARAVGLTTIMTTQYSKPSHSAKVREKQGDNIDYAITHIREALSFCD
jgi:putative hydrolase of the HAD superfamily